MVLVVMEPRCARCDPSPNHWVTAAAAAAGLNLVTALMTTAQWCSPVHPWSMSTYFKSESSSQSVFTMEVLMKWTCIDTYEQFMYIRCTQAAL